MKIIISTHCDTVFQQPYGVLKNGVFTGANDNFASILALGRIIDDPVFKDPTIELQLTEDEEMYMDGAKTIAKKNNPKDTLIIVMDVTEVGSRYGFTIENVHEINVEEIRKALKSFGKKYKIVEDGTESEAWLYAEAGFSVVEVDIPIKGGCHNLSSTTTVENQKMAAEAVLALLYYFKDKDISAIRS